MMSWLLTGGAGYIGSHVLRAMRADSLDVVVLDDLSTGDSGRVPATVPLVTASVLDRDAVQRTLVEYEISGVVHLAAKKSVGESMCNPLHYYRENVLGVVSLLAAMNAVGVRRLVYSSSAAVYGTPATDAVDETAPLQPESPYGRTKLIGEWLVGDAVALGLSSVSLRYFNVVGCADPGLADVGGTNLFPLVMRALAGGERPTLFGEDYPTHDGSCIRDYIHVQDLAEAHVAAARLVASTTCQETVNIGCGRGHSVLEVLSAVGAVTGRDATPEILPRRPGDPAAVVAAVGKARRLLGWQAQHGLDDMVASSWHALAGDDPLARPQAISPAGAAR